MKRIAALLLALVAIPAVEVIHLQPEAPGPWKTHDPLAFGIQTPTVSPDPARDAAVLRDLGARWPARAPWSWPGASEPADDPPASVMRVRPDVDRSQDAHQPDHGEEDPTTIGTTTAKDWRTRLTAYTVTEV